MYTLITGGAGYIGSHVDEKLNKQLINTIVLDNLSAGNIKAVTSKNFIKGDVGDTNLLNKIFSTYEIDTVMHFAGLTSVEESVKYPLLYKRENIEKTKVLISKMIEHNVKNFIFSSTAAVYGEPKYIPIDENHEKNPINPYGESKLEIEKNLMRLSENNKIKYIIFRYFNAASASKTKNIGESHNPERHLIPLLLKNVIDNKTDFNIFGDDYNTKDGTCIRDYIHVEDISSAHYLGYLSLQNNNPSNIYNLGTNDGSSIFDVLHTVEKITGKTINYKIKKRRDGDPAKLVASSEKAFRDLKWKAKHSSLLEIISDAYYWETHRKY